MQTVLLILTIFFPFCIILVSVFLNSHLNTLICTDLYRTKYPEYKWRKECTNPLVYNIMGDPYFLNKKDYCFTTGDLKGEIQKDLRLAEKKFNAIGLGFAYIHILEGMTKLKTDMVYGRKIALTSPEAVMDIIQFNKKEWFSEIGLDIDEYMDDDFIVRTENLTRYVNIYPLLEALLHPTDPSWADRLSTTFIYYNTKNTIWPDLKFVADGNPVYAHSWQIMLPGKLVYPKYERLLNIHNSTAPWRPDDPHRDKRSVWCRGWRHIMALSEPVVKAKNGTVLLTPSGARYCVISTDAELTNNKKCWCLYVTLYLEHFNRKAYRRAQGPYGVRVRLNLVDGIFKAAHSEIRHLWYENGPRVGHETSPGTRNAYFDAVHRAPIWRRFTGDSTMYSDRIVYPALREETVEVARLAIEVNHDGVPDILFSQRYRKSNDEPPSTFPPSTDDDTMSSLPSSEATTSPDEGTNLNISSKICDCVKAHLDALFLNLTMSKRCTSECAKLFLSGSCNCNGTSSQDHKYPISCDCAEIESPRETRSPESGPKKIVQVSSSDCQPNHKSKWFAIISSFLFSLLV